MQIKGLTGDEKKLQETCISFYIFSIAALALYILNLADID